MKIGRNAPCPCGSGKKYKACCLKLDRANPGPPGGAPVRTAAARARVWQADLLPMPARFEDDPDARPAVVMVTADGLVISSEALACPSPEVDDIATELERGIAEAIASIGSSPAEIAVREPEVATVLAARLALSKPPIVVKAAPLPEIEQAMAALSQSMGGPATAFNPSYPQTWAGWGHAEEWIASVFRNSAAYYRSEPWEHFDDFPPIIAKTAAGVGWTLSVMGSAGKTFGLVFYSNPEDYDGVLDGVLGPPSGRILSLTFDKARDLPRPMRKEVARAGWEVASVDAYPTLLALGTPAGGIRATDARDLPPILAAVAEWTQLVADDESLIARGPWRHPETGVELEMEGQLVVQQDDLVLEPGDAEGPAARPKAALALRPHQGRAPEIPTDPWRDRFAAALSAQSLSEKTVTAHTANVELFLDYLTNWVGVPLVAVHEFDLRSFLFDWYPRKVMTSKTDAARIPVSLRRFFDYLEQREGISCPWAGEILSDKESFMARWQDSPGGPWWNEGVRDWQGEHFDELDRRVFLSNVEVPGILTWAPQQGMVEAALNDELQRRWLVWRDQIIRSGVHQPQELYYELCDLETSWLEAPHSEYKGKTPVQAILAERAKMTQRS